MAASTPLPKPTAHTEGPALLRAPHRLAFAAAMGLLLLLSLWWLWLQTVIVFGGHTRPMAWPPGLVHGVAMTHGFFPLFFAGFLFTGGHKWLKQPAPPVRALVPAVACQGLGWTLWLAGAHLGAPLAFFGGGLACLGQGLVWGRYARLVWRSRVDDRTHAALVTWAGGLGLISLAALLAALWRGQLGLAQTWLHTGLWGFVGVTFVTVVHRMIPFFGSSALPLASFWRPVWVLVFLLAALGLKIAGLWWTSAGSAASAWTGFQAFCLLVSGWVVLWLALVWGVVQNLNIRLLAMLHMGFVWLGLGFLLDACNQLWVLLGAGPPWPLAALHATTMGFLGSTMVAMVTRVSCGQSGRPHVADNPVWRLFWVLQAATLVRIAAAVLPVPWTATLTVAAALLWCLATVPWALRLGRWYVQPRPDGRPG